MVVSPVALGEVVDGKYRVEHVLGEGGLGIVLAATHLGLDRRVALKFLAPQMLASTSAVERFSREARAAASLKSEHVAHVLDVGTLHGAMPYIVMELLDGCDLKVLLERRGRLTPQEAVDYVLQACEAMAEAHAAGIVHRDLKPANLFLATDAAGEPAIKVLDFGIAKTQLALAGSDHSLTSTSGLIGSPLYMSPEQLESAREVDARSDIWALGAILYELVTGQPPFSAVSFARLCMAILNSTPIPPTRLNPEVPLALEAVILRCLEKNRDRRFGSVPELAQALRSSLAQPSFSVPARRGRSSALPIVLAAGFGALAVAGLSVVFVLARPGRPEVASATPPSAAPPPPLPSPSLAISEPPPQPPSTPSASASVTVAAEPKPVQSPKPARPKLPSQPPPKKPDLLSDRE